MDTTQYADYYGEYEQHRRALYRRALGERECDPAYEESGRDPEGVRVFRGALVAVVLSALIWVPILWLLL